MYIFFYVVVEGRFVDFNIDGFSCFSGNMFAVLIYYLEVEDVGLRMVVENAVFVNCTSDMTIVHFSLYLPKICWIFLSKKGYNFLLGRTICKLCSLEQTDPPKSLTK